MGSMTGVLIRLYCWQGSLRRKGDCTEQHIVVTTPSGVFSYSPHDTSVLHSYHIEDTQLPVMAGLGGGSGQKAH